MSSCFSSHKNDDTVIPPSKTNNAIEEALPPIRFINYNDLKKLPSFPRHPENAGLCINEDTIDRSISLVIFISHCWLRGWDGAAGWDGKNHPDNASHDKFQLMLEGIEHLKRLAPGMSEVYVWIDYGCINQNADPGELKQLDKVIQACDLMLTVVADCYDNEWKDWHPPSIISNWYQQYKAKAWSEGDHAYLNRCWCRVEMMYAANIPLCGDVSDRAKHFIAGLAEAVKANRRPHYLYGTRDKMINGLPTGLPPLRSTFFNEYNPMMGTITKESDRMKIKELMEALQRYIDTNKATVGYIGERNPTGQAHGHGTYTYASGNIYIGEYRDGKKSGQGTYTYANGDVYVGEFRDDKCYGQGTYNNANGDVYVGEYRDNKRTGQGTYTCANGNVYVGEFKDGKKHGHGTYNNANGDVYVGEFEHDYRTKGTHNFASGDVYVGEWKKGRKSGQGTLTFADGSVKKGTFNDDKFTGTG